MLRIPIREKGLLSFFIGTTDCQLEVEWIGCDRETMSAEAGPGLFVGGEGGLLGCQFFLYGLKEFVEIEGFLERSSGTKKIGHV